LTENTIAFLESLPTAAHVAKLVGTAEHLYFEAKRCATPFSDFDKNHLSEALSGFANADGGTLIYGLVAKGGDRDKPDVVTSVDPLQKLSHAHSEVLALVGQLVQPPVEGVQVLQREFSKQPGSGFLLVYIPASDQAPHRAVRDREYYRRHGSGFFRMEHYEVAEMFGRRKKPSLRLWTEVRKRYDKEGTVGRCDIIVGLENLGRGLARYPSLKLSGMTQSRPSPYGLDGNGRTGLPPRASGYEDEYLFAGGADDVIHPRTRVPITVIRHYQLANKTNFEFPDFVAEYAIAAEDMLLSSGSVHVPGEVITRTFSDS
jgi:hypothetical protein